jgi:hypothetical protein
MYVLKLARWNSKLQVQQPRSLKSDRDDGLGSQLQNSETIQMWDTNELYFIGFPHLTTAKDVYNMNLMDLAFLPV